MILRIKTISANSPEKIAKLVEEESNRLNAFASPIHRETKNKWYAFLYYNEGTDLPNEKKPFKKSEFKGFKNPNAPASVKQMNLVKNIAKKLGKKAPEGLTMAEASKIIEGNR